MAHGVMIVISHPFRCFGLGEQCFVGGDSCLFPLCLFHRTDMSANSALLTAPTITRPKTLWELTKSELIAEARARNLWFHDSWTARELRSLIQEDRKAASSQQLPTAGLSQMTIEQLKTKADEMGYKVPTHATRGTILRIIRDQGGMGPESLMTFGRFAGKKFSETPVSYREWAVREVSSNDNPSEQLVMYANWWQGELFRMEKEDANRVSSSVRTPNYMDPETHASIPYTDEAGSSASWSEVTVHSSPIREGYGAKPKARVPPAPRPTATRRSATAREGVDGPGSAGGSDRRGAEFGGATGGSPGPPRYSSPELELRTPGGHQEEDEEVFYECESHVHVNPDNFGNHHGEDELYDIDDYLTGKLEGIHRETSEQVCPISINSGGSGDVIQREPTGVNSAHVVPEIHAECEKIAKQKLNLKKFSYDDLLEIARLLPLRSAKGARGSRRGGGVPYNYFLGGMYTYGKFFGLAKGSKNLPWTTRYINSFARDKFSGGWTSFVIFRDTATQVHADVHNLPGTSVTTVSFGSFSGGELWIESGGDDGQVYRESPDGTNVVRTKETPFTFDGKIKHATQPWEGERWALSCFTTRGYSQANTALRDELRELRFPLRGLVVPCQGTGLSAPDTHRVPRPRKSTRKGLWKTTNRLVALATWCTTAASLYVAENFPSPRSPEAVTLFEVGGITKTIEATEMNYITVEPYEYDSGITFNENISNVDKIIGDFSPPTVWVHGEQPPNFIDGLLPVFHKQVILGRQLAFEASDGHPLWSSKALKELLERHDGRYHRRPAEPGVLRFNDPGNFNMPQDEETEITQFVNYVCHPDYHEEIASADAPHLGRPFDEGGDPERANGSGRPSCGEPPGAGDRREVRKDDDEGRGTVFVVDQERASGSRGPSSGEPRGAEAISFGQGKAISPEVKSSLKRLHQNLGHPTNLDLARHLRLAGADTAVVEACKRLNCQVCHRNQRGGSAKPATLPNLLEFNQLVAVDAFYVYDCDGEKVELMMVVDVGTGFVSAGLLQGHSGATMESSFCSIWSNTFGAPGTMIVDLESGLQAGLGRFSEWHGTKIRVIAGQAHWQNGTVERAIRTWKEVWGRLVDEWSASFES